MGQALNRALDFGGLGEIIVVLDDDMSPHPDWFKGIAESCERCANADVFSGRSYVVWPDDRSPAWARHPSVMGWGFSVADQGDNYKPLPPGATFSGNHFWFRSRVLGPDRRFSDMWLTEPDFILRLTEEGRQGVWAPGAIAGHRIQPDLVDKTSARRRALMIGRAIGELRFAAHRNNKKIVKFRKHPGLGRVFCVAKLLFWSGFSAGAHFCLDADTRFSLGLVALERKTAYAEMLRRT